MLSQVVNAPFPEEDTAAMWAAANPDEFAEARAAMERALGAGPDDSPELDPFEQWEAEQEKKRKG